MTDRLPMKIMNLEEVARDINLIGDFCSKRDIKELTRNEIRSALSVDSADLFVLTGGCVLCGVDVLASAIKNNVAKKYIIVGGAGHTTPTFRKKVSSMYPDVKTKELSESEILNAYLKYAYNLSADYLEKKSTNSGENVLFLRNLLEEKNLPHKRVIVSQDGTMQQRMDATIRKYFPKDTKLISYACYKATVVVSNGELRFKEQIHGMWEMDRYINLLMGEIPRLYNDDNGYGPKGKDFIAEVDVPDDVYKAYLNLKQCGYESRI